MAKAQNDYNPYLDFTQGGYYPTVMHIGTYSGEYQVYIDTSVPWVIGSTKLDTISWKIEAVSYPFITNPGRTSSLPQDSFRILTLPRSFDYNN